MPGRKFENPAEIFKILPNSKSPYTRWFWRAIISNGPFQTDDSRITDSFENLDSIGDAILPNGIAILALYSMVLEGEKRFWIVSVDSQNHKSDSRFTILRIHVWKSPKCNIWQKNVHVTPP